MRKCLAHLRLLFAALMTNLQLILLIILTYACWQGDKINSEKNKLTNMAAYIIILLWEVKYLPFYVVNLSNVLYVTRLSLLNSPSYVGNVILVVTMCNSEGLRMFTIYMFTCTYLWPLCYILLHGHNKSQAILNYFS